MKIKISLKMISFLLVLATLLTTLPLIVFAEEIRSEGEGVEVTETYLKDVKLVQAATKEEAKTKLGDSGYTFLDANLNEGTEGEGIWMGYLTTNDPTEAIYDMKLMDTKGGFTRSSMEKALASQESAVEEMAEDLCYLVDEFIEAYKGGSVAAEKAYMALNFFRVVDGETELVPENGLGYQVVNGNLTIGMLTQIILFCDPVVLDSIVKILTMGIQIKDESWMALLSKMGPYDEDVEYMEDEGELSRRAEQLLGVLQLYSEVYNVMVKSGLMPDELDENFNPVYKKDGKALEQSVGKADLTAAEADLQKLEEGRYKFYKLAADELAKYPYGKDGKTLKDFFVSLEKEDDESVLYPMVSALTDGEFAALTYGCFLELAIGANATDEDFSSYDETYADITSEVGSVYLYRGVNQALFEDDAIIGFTDTAQRHMATTGDLEFFESDNPDEAAWETGTRIVTGIGVACMVVMGLTKITVGVTALVAAATSTQTAAMAATIKYGTMIGGLKGMLVAVVIVAVSLLITYLVAISKDEEVDWENDPMLQYVFDVSEATFMQSSDDGIATDFMKRPVFTFYEAVTDIDGGLVDLNARSEDAARWIQLFVSRDRRGIDAKPIKCDAEEGILRVQKGSGVTPEGYTPVTHFGEVIAYNLNQWDSEDRVNGIYLFYQRDTEIAVDDGMTLYISEIQLQTGESDAHCIKLLEDAGYTPINMNLSPDLTDGDFMFEDKIYTYLGYKTSTSKASAIRDIRLVYGPAQGSIQYGAATYAACGSNGYVTLYATKYEISGTPLLAGGLICVDKQSKAPIGYEPVCMMSGGPAVPVNVNNDGEVRADNGFMYLYFLPETTFTSGKQYLGGLAVLDGNAGLYDGYYSQIPVPSVTEDLWGGYVPVAGNVSRLVSMLAYYPTYNPYRAVYGIKAAGLPNVPQSLVLGGTPYYEWNRINWGYQWHKDVADKDLKDRDVKKDLTLIIQTTGAVPYDDGAFYLTGNTKTGNTFDAKKGKMSKAQPIEISDVMYLDSNSKITVPEAFYPVVDAFSSYSDVPMLYNTHYASFTIYTKTKNEEKPYVSDIMAVDTFTLYRLYGGSEKGVTTDQITEAMRYSYLVGQGATDIRSLAPAMGMNDITSIFGILDYKNHTQFGFTRASKGTQALRDVFFYFNGFSTDAPPKELYRGSVKYTLLCEVPHNLMGAEDAPKASAYLYGTTNSKAGDRIIDLQISTYPYMEGYETVRTMGGRSLWSEMRDYAMSQAKLHPMDVGSEFFSALAEFLDNDDGTAQIENYYLHIKRENDEKVEKPYIEELYLTSFEHNVDFAIDNLFDQGAETFIKVNLNEDAGGDFIYLGYSYTSDPDLAIKEIRAYHKNTPPTTLTDDDGRVFELVKALDLNKDAGGDYIYLYTSKGLASKNEEPIIEVSVGFEVITEKTWRVPWIGGTEINMTTHCTKRWDSDKNSDLNRGAGGEYVYLTYATVDTLPAGLTPEKAPNYGNDKTYSRDPFADQTPDGKYVGGVYVMDKETIRLENIKAGVLPASSSCKDVTDEAVFNRLRAMGATTIIQTPIMVNSDGYFEGNDNKVFIGYSRTDVREAAITDLAIKAEITSIVEPPAKFDVNNNKYTLVAEAADSVNELPYAINLIGISGGRDVLLPRLYLYYSISTGSDPITDISIDDLPISNGSNTVRSANMIDPFADIYKQADDLRELAEKDDLLDKYEDVYAKELSAWMSEIADLFDPEDADVKPFYIHVQRYTEDPKSYIGEVFIAKGDTRHEALSNLIAFEPDGFIDVDLNEDAGGDYVYMAYKRVRESRDALTDVMVYEGEKIEPSRRLTINGERVKYTLAAEIDLNSDAGGVYLYLYTTDSNDVGNPIKELNVFENVDSYLKCGVERVTVRRAEGTVFTNEYIDLNKRAGGDSLYLVMTRETTEGHRSNNVVTEEIITDATCTDDGCRIDVTACADCGTRMETVVEVLEAHGRHTDDANDGDHDCDVCGKRDVNEHTIGGYVEDDPDNPGKFKFVRRCTDCGEPTGEEYPITESKTYNWDMSGSASLFGSGSLIAVCALAGVALLAAIVIFMKKKKITSINKGGSEE